MTRCGIIAIAGLLSSLCTAMMGAQQLTAAAPVPAPATWPSVGQGVSNLRSQPAETAISTANVGKLAVKWVFTAAADVQATPTVSDGVVYFPDSAGNLYAVNAATGAKLWSHTIYSYSKMGNSLSRVSPVIYNDELILGDNLSVTEVHSGAHVFAVKRSDGSLIWDTRVDTNPAAIITGSPVALNNVVYVGVSSLEEGLTEGKGYSCCTFRGSVVALNATTGKILWQTYMTPANNGQPGEYSGAAIWSPPAIDVSRSQLFVATGNNYSVPSTVETCQDVNIAKHATHQCTVANNYFDSVVALDLATGAVRWAERVSIYDAYNLACHLSPAGPACPDPSGEDFDFGGGGPNFFGNVVGAGSKSGYYDMFDASKGKYIWKTAVGPGGPLGGILWGTASDGKSVFISSANSTKASWTLLSGQKVTWGFWSALDFKTGKILWQTPEPTKGTEAISSMSTANGVLYVGSLDAAGHMYAVDTATGKVLWSFASGGSVLDAPSIVDGVVYWGSGYKRFGGTGNTKLYAFALP